MVSMAMAADEWQDEVGEQKVDDERNQGRNEDCFEEPQKARHGKQRCVTMALGEVEGRTVSWRGCSD